MPAAMPAADRLDKKNAADSKTAAQRLAASDFAHVAYRPKRIQTLTPEYEVVLKQMWAFFMKYWGYDIALTDQDLSQPSNFVVSSETAARHPNSDYDPATIAPEEKTKRRGFWGSGSTKSELEAIEPSERAKLIATNISEDYIAVSVPDQLVYAYAVHHNSIVHLGELFDDDSKDHELRKIKEEFKAKIGLAGVNKRSEDAKANPKCVCHPNPTIHPGVQAFNGKDLHKACWESCRADPLDNLMLRFIRARRANIDNALVMIASDMNWRVETKPTEILFKSDIEYHVNSTGPGVINNLSLQKCWAKGQDLEGNLLFFFKSDRHFASDAPPAEMRIWLLLQIEWAKLMLRDIKTGADCVTMFFDLTGFSLKNADYATMKFVLEVFEAHQPESLAHVIVYNAPWIFYTFFNIIKPWIDPDIASKIKFCKNMEEASVYVDPKDVPTCMGGLHEYNGEYVKPTAEELRTPKQKDSHYYNLIRERHSLKLDILERTKRWVEATDPVVSSRYLNEKIEINIRLAQNFMELDPYIRRRGMYDRNGTMQENFSLN